MDPYKINDILSEMLTDLCFSSKNDAFKKTCEFLTATESMILQNLRFCTNTSIGNDRFTELLIENINVQETISILTRTQSMLTVCLNEIDSFMCPELFDSSQNECSRMISEISTIMESLRQM